MIEKIQVKNTEEIILNIEYYSNKFLSDGILYFKNLNPSEQEKVGIMQALGEIVGFSSQKESHLEDHRNTFDRHNKSMTESDLFIEWHLENMHKKNPEIAALWHMSYIKPGSFGGETYFINMTNIYNFLSENEKIIMNKLFIKSTIGTDSTGKFIYHKDMSRVISQPLVCEHYSDKRQTLRIPLYEDEYIICRGDDSLPDSEEIFLIEKIQQLIEENKNAKVKNKIEWEQGDVAVVDLFVMSHAVSGGFLKGDRILSRIWGYNVQDSKEKELK